MGIFSYFSSATPKCQKCNTDLNVSACSNCHEKEIAMLKQQLYVEMKNDIKKKIVDEIRNRKQGRKIGINTVVSLLEEIINDMK